MWIILFLRERREQSLGIIHDAWEVSIFLRECILQSGIGDPSYWFFGDTADHWVPHVLSNCYVDCSFTKHTINLLCKFKYLWETELFLVPKKKMCPFLYKIVFLSNISTFFMYCIPVLIKVVFFFLIFDVKMSLWAASQWRCVSTWQTNLRQHTLPWLL